MIVGSMQTQVVWTLDGGLWAIKIEGRKSREQQFAIMTIGPVDEQSQGQPTTITQQAALGSLFAAIGGSRADGGMQRKGLERSSYPRSASPRQC